VLGLAGCGGSDESAQTATAPRTAKTRLADAERAVYARTPGLYSLIVMRDGRPLLERYYDGASASQPFPVFSITKSVVSALAGIAIADGKLELQQPLGELLDIPAGADPRVRKITLEQLLTMSAGWDDGKVGGPNVVRNILLRPLAWEPGSTWFYDNGSAHLVSAVLTRATGMSAAEYAQRRLFGPLNIQPLEWPADPQGNSSGSAGLVLRARELALLGELFRRGGEFGGRQIVPRSWAEASTAPHVGTDDPLVRYGYFWWIGDATKTYAAIGYGGQVVAVAPREHAVVVWTCDPARAPDTRVLLRDYLLPALRG
jgi:CubicO group peptidase (beta-lactamase class C family)